MSIKDKCFQNFSHREKMFSQRDITFYMVKYWDKIGNILYTKLKLTSFLNHTAFLKFTDFFKILNAHIY